MKWKPKDGQYYWYLDGLINWGKIKIERDYWASGLDSCYTNVFKTRKEAVSALKKIRNAIK